MRARSREKQFERGSEKKCGHVWFFFVVVVVAAAAAVACFVLLHRRWGHVHKKLVDKGTKDDSAHIKRQLYTSSKTHLHTHTHSLSPASLLPLRMR